MNPNFKWKWPEEYSVYGAAAPKKLREAEMYNIVSYGDTDFTSENSIGNFDFLMSTWGEQQTAAAKAAGAVPLSYFDAYHLYMSSDSQKKIAMLDESGNPVSSDYPSDRPGDELALVCHNSNTVLEWAKNYVNNCLDFGAQGMFLDDIRTPYEQGYGQVCHSANHYHILSGENSTNYITNTMRELYKLIKTRNFDYFAIFNGGDITASWSQRDEFRYSTLWKYCDACMQENFMYDSNGNKWTSMDMQDRVAAAIAPGIREGKAELILSYSYDKMKSANQIRKAVSETLAYCRMYDFIWSDFATLCNSLLPQSEVSSIYAIRTGLAGKLGEYHGKVVDSLTGEPIANVQITSTDGNASAQTDANGNFTISMPVNCYTVLMNRDGYTSVIDTVTGYKCELKMQRERGKVYYVSPDGNDLNDGLTPATAWRSIGYGDAAGIIHAGDTVVVSEGTYNLPEQTVFTSSGTAKRPITYTAQGDVLLRIRDGQGYGILQKGAYTRWIGFDIEGYGTGCYSLMRVTGKGTEVADCHFSDTAFYNAAFHRHSNAAVDLNANEIFFHHNIIGDCIYSDCALSVDGCDIRIFNNTLDGARIKKDRAQAAMMFHSSCQRIQVKNNISVGFSKAYSGYTQWLGTFQSNLFSDITDSPAAYFGTGDGYTDDLRFMYRPSGDYDLKSDSVAVDSGTDVGFACYGGRSDIGACESNYGADYSGVTEQSGICRYRTFADTVVLTNISTTDRELSIPLGRSGLVLQDTVRKTQYVTDKSGVLKIFVEAESSAVLQAKKQ